MADSEGGGGGEQIKFFIFLGVMVLMAAISYAQNGGSSWVPSLSVAEPNYNSSSDSKTETERIQRQLAENGRGYSPYRGKVRIENYTYNSDPNNEYITLAITAKGNEQIPISGWRVESGPTGKGRPIPNGVILPFAGSINSEQPIFVKNGDKVVLVSGRSPSGYSFKVNICSGYFSRFQNFNPSLNADCPRPEKYSLPQRPNALPDSCLDYLESLPACFLPTATIPQHLSMECQNFVANKYNYNSCISTHKDRSDFYRNEWRVYLNSSEGLWKNRRETIQILDKDNKIITSVSY